MVNEDSVIRENIAKIRENIAASAIESGRKPEDITFIAVTKNFGVDPIKVALGCGITDIAENKVQEMCDKYPQLTPEKWHLIGHLQTNKVKYIIDKADMIQSVDSIKLVDEIERQAEKHDLIKDILLQVNTSGEETKFGASVEDTYKLAEYCSEKKHIKVRGLMTIAPLYANEFAIRLHFDNTHKLYIDIADKKYDNISMEYLSMGMSGDYTTAIKHGANMVRVGSAIFGNRYI